MAFHPPPLLTPVFLHSLQQPPPLGFSADAAQPTTSRSSAMLSPGTVLKTLQATGLFDNLTAQPRRQNPPPVESRVPPISLKATDLRRCDGGFQIAAELFMPSHGGLAVPVLMSRSFCPVPFDPTAAWRTPTSARSTTTSPFNAANVVFGQLCRAVFISSLFSSMLVLKLCIYSVYSMPSATLPESKRSSTSTSIGISEGHKSSATLIHTCTADGPTASRTGRRTLQKTHPQTSMLMPWTGAKPCGARTSSCLPPPLWFVFVILIRGHFPSQLHGSCRGRTGRYPS